MFWKSRIAIWALSGVIVLDFPTIKIGLFISSLIVSTANTKYNKKGLSFLRKKDVTQDLLREGIEK